jgi:hypothetical protein
MKCERRGFHFGHSQLMWAGADVLGLFSRNVVSFSANVSLGCLLFSVNVG